MDEYLYNLYLDYANKGDDEKANEALFEHFNYVNNLKKKDQYTNELLFKKNKKIRNDMNIPDTVCISKFFRIYRENIQNVSESTVQKLSGAKIRHKKSRAGRKPREPMELNIVKENDQISTLERDVCSNCKEDTLIENSTQGEIVCTNCGNVFITSSSSLKHETIYDSDKIHTVYINDNIAVNTYNPCQHFRDMIYRSQAYEVMYIDGQQSGTDFIENIKQYMDQNHIKIESLNYNTLKWILKQNNLQKYYQHIHKIKYLLTGIPPPRFTEEQIQILLNDNQRIIDAWKKIKPSGRKNIFSYQVQMYKLCELHEWNEFLPLFSLFVSMEKVEKTNQVWKLICNEIGWKYIPLSRFAIHQN